MFRALPAALFVVAAVASPSIRDVVVAAKHPVVTIHAKEFAFVTPKSITAGSMTFRLVNDGKQLHHLSIVKLAKGKTVADYKAAMEKRAPTPWATSVGGPNAAVPGATSEATLDLEAGNYFAICFIPSPGEEIPHAMKGMIAEFSVVAPGGVTQAGAPMSYVAIAPVPDVHLEVKDYGFKFSKALTAGKHTIHVMNSANQDHEVVLLRLAPGKSVQDFGMWAGTGMKGPPPAEPVSGMSGIGKGRTGTFDVNLTPGHYGLICFIPDAKDGKPHSAHGMSQEITIQ